MNLQHPDNRPLHTRDLKKALGFDPDFRWPAGFSLGPVMVDNVEVFIRPKTKKGMEMRVFCLCPRCGKEVSAGRLTQHRQSLPCKLADRTPDPEVF